MLRILRGDNCLVGWFTELSLLKMRGLPVRWLVPGMTASWRHQGEARRGESNRIGELYPSKFFFLSFFAPCEICFHNLGVARVAFNIQLSNKELKLTLAPNFPPSSVSTFKLLIRSSQSELLHRRKHASFVEYVLGEKKTNALNER